MKHLLVALIVLLSPSLLAQNNNIFFTVSSKKQQTIDVLNQIAQRYSAIITPAIKLKGKKRNRSSNTIFIARTNNTLSTQDLFKELQQQPSVIDIAFEPINEIFHVPNDPFSSPLTPKGQATLKTHGFYEAWDIQKGDTNIIIGVVDTGIWYEHEDIKSTIYYNYKDPIDGLNNDKDLLFADSLTDDYRGWDVGDNDNDPSSTFSAHGLRVAGLIGATSNNNLGISGLVPQTRILHVKAAPDVTPNSLTAGYTGLVYAVNKGCSIINLSWGSTNDPGPIFRQLIKDIAQNNDVLLVAAAGNSSDDTYYYPASYPDVISVSSIKSDSTKPKTAVHNYLVDFNAVGSNTKTLNNKGISSYINDYGTSFSAPVISAALALIKAEFPQYSPQQLIQQMKVTAFKNDTLATNKNYEYKFGKMLNIKEALTNSELPGYKVARHNQPDTILISKYTTQTNFVFDITNVLKNEKKVNVRFKNLTDNLEIDTTISLSLDKGQVEQVSIPIKFREVQHLIDTSAILVSYSKGVNYHDYDIVTNIIKESPCLQFGQQFGYLFAAPETSKDKGSFTLVGLPLETEMNISYNIPLQNESKIYISDNRGELTLENLESGIYSNITVSIDDCSFTYVDDFDLSPVTSLVDKQNNSIFPNPVSNFLNTSINKIKQVVIINDQGTIIKKISHSSSLIDLRDLSNGNYIIIINSNSGVHQFKISKI